MAAGREPRDIYVEVLARRSTPSATCGNPAPWGSSRNTSPAAWPRRYRSARGEVRRRGRKKGVVIVAMPPGERHGLGVAMLADILTQDGYEVRNLGPDTPAPSLVAAMRDADQLAAVVVSVVDATHRRAAEQLLSAAQRERPALPLFAGGYAVPDERSAVELGAAGWVLDPRELAGLIERLGPG